MSTQIYALSRYKLGQKNRLLSGDFRRYSPQSRRFPLSVTGHECGHTPLYRSDLNDEIKTSRYVALLPAMPEYRTATDRGTADSGGCMNLESPDVANRAAGPEEASRRFLRNRVKSEVGLAVA